MSYGPDVTLADIDSDPAAAEIVRRHLPGLLDGPASRLLPFFALRAVASRARPIGEEPADLGPMLEELGRLSRPASPRPAWPAPGPASDAYEQSSVPRGSARVRPIAEAEQWCPTEVAIDGPSHGNPFTDVALDAVFRCDGQDVAVGGFYDGDGSYVIRFCPPKPGSWRFETRSNARSLDGLTGSVQVASPGSGNRGPVVVRDRFHFAYQDGTPYLPLGTTVYALTHQDEELQEETLRTLAQSPFTKLRLCVFPKSFSFNRNEPARYPFERASDGSWDFARFDVEFFRHLELRVAQLGDIGVHADVILFHSYDRWGFSQMPAWADDLYTRYVVRRLAAFPHVWWSLANEYDFVPGKDERDWERLAAVVQAEDHVGHLVSIHNGVGLYDYRRPWVTHCSIQRVDAYRTAENVDQWRARYGKPVVVDECGYEGDIDLGWGNLSGQELVRRCWEGAVRGGYVNHGETYVDPDEILWWSKGGQLRGESPTRIGFLARLIAETPTGRFDPLPSDWDAPCGGDEDHRVLYFGFARPTFRWIVTPPGSWHIDVIDTWQMTVDSLPGLHGGRIRVDLPGRQYMAVRLRRASDHSRQ